MTLDDDVAALLEQVRNCRKARTREVVNEALRLGLEQLARPSEPKKGDYQIEPAPGRPRLENVDDVAGALEFAEGDGHR